MTTNESVIQSELIDFKDWKKLGFDFFSAPSPVEAEIIENHLESPDPFFGSKIKDSQILMHVPQFKEENALSLNWWREFLHNCEGIDLSLQFTDIYQIGSSFNNLVNPGWYLFTSKIVPGSLNKTWHQQLDLLRAEYRTPNINELITFLVMAQIAGVKLKKDVFARTVHQFYGEREGYYLRVGQLLYNRLNVVAEDQAKDVVDTGIYACKKII